MSTQRNASESSDITPDTQELFEAVEKQVREEHPIKHANGMAVGASGTSKSTIINANFRCKMAETGIGEPVTLNIEKHTTPDSLFTLYDTRGFERGKYEETCKCVTDHIRRMNASKNPDDHLHFIWYMMNSIGARFTRAEIQMIQDLNKECPVIVVLSISSGTANALRTELQKELGRDWPIVIVRAEPVHLKGGRVLEACGMEELTRVTMDKIPEGQQNAFLRVTRFNMEAKAKKAKLIIAGAAAAAALAGAVPIPFSDYFILVPIQVSMLAAICWVYELDIGRTILASLVMGAIGGTKATLVGKEIAKWAVSMALRWIPCAGVVTAVVQGCVAAGVTTGMGMLLHSILKKHAANGEPDIIVICKEFGSSIVRGLDNAKSKTAAL